MGRWRGFGELVEAEDVEGFTEERGVWWRGVVGYGV